MILVIITSHPIICFHRRNIAFVGHVVLFERRMFCLVLKEVTVENSIGVINLSGEKLTDASCW